MTDQTPIGFVYIWINKVNLKWYIGSHKGTTTDGYTASGTNIKRAFRKYGIENFERSILYEGLNYRQEEENWLIALDAANSDMSYNLSSKAAGCAGYKHSEEWKANHSARLKGRYKGRTPWNKGIKHTQKTKDKISAANTGKKRSDEIRIKMSEDRKGRSHRHHTAETKAKISITAKNRKKING